MKQALSSFVLFPPLFSFNFKRRGIGIFKCRALSVVLRAVSCPLAWGSLRNSSWTEGFIYNCTVRGCCLTALVETAFPQ